MKKISWGFIGCGDVTEVKSGPAFGKIEDSEVVAVMRRNAKKVKDYAQRHQIARYYTDADELIHDPAVNAIYIATPPNTHTEYTIRALEAGKPVYVEKPMARNYKECKRMVDASQKASLPLFVAYYRRCLPSFLKVKEIIQSGVLGKIRLADIRLHYPARPEDNNDQLPWRVRPEISGGGYFFDLASHQLDLLDFLLGSIREVAGHAKNQAGLYEAEDAVVASWEFKTGVLGSGSWCFTVHPSERTDRMTISGSKGSISFACFDDEPIILHTASGVQSFDLPYPTHVQQPLIQTIVADLLGTGKCPSTGESAARTALVMDKIVGRK